MSVLSDEIVYTHRSGTLYDALELILDRGIVIDAFVRISLVGIEIIKIDARIVIASVDTYLRFAEVCNRLDLETVGNSRTVPELFGAASGPVGKAAVAGKAGKSVGKAGARKAAKSVTDRVKGVLPGHGAEADDADAEERESVRQTGRRHAQAADDGDWVESQRNGKSHSRRRDEGNW